MKKYIVLAVAALTASTQSIKCADVSAGAVRETLNVSDQLRLDVARVNDFLKGKDVSDVSKEQFLAAIQRLKANGVTEFKERGCSNSVFALPFVMGGIFGTALAVNGVRQLYTNYYDTSSNSQQKRNNLISGLMKTVGGTTLAATMGYVAYEILSK